jgi:putative toxin-antitoxin system antitoxin component (TIGR02293 family)
MQVSINRILAGLGGDRFIKRPIRHDYDLIELVKEGLPMESVAFLQRNLGFTNKEMSHILAISESTYQRRIRAKSTLTQDETEKAISLSEVYEKGIEVFEDKPDFSYWLTSRIPSLLNQRPVDLLDSMIGRKQVTNVLNAILHGLYL